MMEFNNVSKQMRSRLLLAAAPMVSLAILLLFADYLDVNIVPVGMQQSLYTPENNPSRTAEKHGPFEPQLARLIRGEDLKRLEATGFACDTAKHSIVCVSNQPVIIETTTKKNITVHIPTNQTHVQEETSIKPYARQEDKYLLQFITPVKILLHSKPWPPICQFNHQFPAVIFSSGLTGNQFHEFNDIIIPLFITIKHFKSHVVMILEDYNPTFLSKYSKILSRLSDYEVINPAAEESVHCFPGAIVGLKYHDNLGLNYSEIPGGHSVPAFRQFLRETFNLKFTHVSELKKPTIMLISREKTRRFLNEDEIIRMIREMGFRLVVVRNQELSNLTQISSLVNSCSVLVGVHGAGLTNELFLPDGAVMVQVEPLGLEWASTTYFGDPAGAMDLKYLRYKIAPEESSLVEMYGPDHPVIKDPASISAKGYLAARAVYVDQQDVRVNVIRLKETLSVAMGLVRNSTLPKAIPN